jgi:hypothetical protein
VLSGSRHRLGTESHGGDGGLESRGLCCCCWGVLGAQTRAERGGKDVSYESASGRSDCVSGYRELLQEPGSARKGRGAFAGRQGPGHI